MRGSVRGLNHSLTCIKEFELLGDVVLDSHTWFLDFNY